MGWMNKTMPLLLYPGKCLVSVAYEVGCFSMPHWEECVNLAHRNSIPGPFGQWHRSVRTMLWRPTINYLLTHPLLTYLLTSCSRVPLEKLTGSQIVKYFPALYEKRKFIVAVTTARHLSLNYIII